MNGARVYNEHEGFRASFRDKIPHKGRKKPKVKFWSKHFKQGRESIEDDSGSGRPVETSSKEMCQNVEDIILLDRRLKVIAHE